ncbi:MAG TPA: M48 family metallopeptidase [bacterium]|nr:M48 family metallopeptidase [bacterium]
MKNIAFFMSLILLAGCATYYNPMTQKSEYTLYTEQDEMDMGAAADKKVQEEYKVIATPSQLKKIGDKVAATSDRPNISYTFRVIENEEVNAFALPGGFIYLHTGLLQKIENESELANIIGHEIAHIVARDGVNNMQKSILYSIPSQILLRNRSKAIQDAVNAAFSVTMLKYSRSTELRADTYGVTYAYRAGYNPEGMITFFQKLQEMESGSNSIQISFLRSHPVVSERIKNVQNVIQTLK